MKPLFIAKEKRSITNENENEFMPVTKRMNFLSIENSETTSSSRSSLPNEEDSNDSGYRYCQQSTTTTTTTIDHHSSTNGPNNDLMYLNEIYRTYNPSLKEEQNPNYFDANRILFEAHQMRILRIQTQIQQQQQPTKLKSPL